MQCWGETRSGFSISANSTRSQRSARTARCLKAGWQTTRRYGLRCSAAAAYLRPSPALAGSRPTSLSSMIPGSGLARLRPHRFAHSVRESVISSGRNSPAADLARAPTLTRCLSAARFTARAHSDSRAKGPSQRCARPRPTVWQPVSNGGRPTTAAQTAVLLRACTRALCAG